MLKNRYFILGLGMGFILCGILLVFYGEAFTSSINTELTVEEIKVLADEKNLYIYTEEELNKLINISNNKKENDKNIKDDIIKDKIEGNSFNFTIPYGLDSYQIAELLFEMGVLEDTDKFMEILEINHLTKGIIAGDYEYILNLSIQELIELITKTEIVN